MADTGGMEVSVGSQGRLAKEAWDSYKLGMVAKKRR